MKTNLPPLNIVLKVISLYFFINGCGETDNGCTTHSIGRNTKPHHSLLSSEAVGNISKSALPLSLSVTIASDQSPIGMQVTGGIHSSLSIDIPMDFEMGQSKSYSLKTEMAFFAGETYEVRDQNDNLAFESIGDPRLEILGWSYTKPILFLQSDEQVDAVDFSTVPPTSVPLVSAVSLRQDDTIFVWNSGHWWASLLDSSLRTLKSFKIDWRDLTYDASRSTDSYKYFVTVTDANGHQESSIEFVDSEGRSPPRDWDICLSSDQKELQISHSLYYHLEKKVFLTGDLNCKRSHEFGIDDPSGVFHSKLSSPSTKWEGTLTVKTISKDFETEHYDWKCNEKAFVIGQLRADYELTLRSEAGDEVKQSGTVGLDLGKPNCVSQYSGG